jgi:hypothetical protein
VIVFPDMLAVRGTKSIIIIIMMMMIIIIIIIIIYGTSHNVESIAI